MLGAIRTWNSVCLFSDRSKWPKNNFGKSVRRKKKVLQICAMVSYSANETTKEGPCVHFCSSNGQEGQDRVPNGTTMKWHRPSYFFFFGLLPYFWCIHIFTVSGPKLLVDLDCTQKYGSIQSKHHQYCNDVCGLKRFSFTYGIASQADALNIKPPNVSVGPLVNLPGSSQDPCSFHIGAPIL